MRISDWSSDVCSSDLFACPAAPSPPPPGGVSPLPQVAISSAENRNGHRDNKRTALMRLRLRAQCARDRAPPWHRPAPRRSVAAPHPSVFDIRRPSGRSEEHTSELQSLMRISYAVFCLKKKK